MYVYIYIYISHIVQIRYSSTLSSSRVRRYVEGGGVSKCCKIGYFCSQAHSLSCALIEGGGISVVGCMHVKVLPLNVFLA